ncbi:MAG: XisI protein [Caldilineaceae bacterium]
MDSISYATIVKDALNAYVALANKYPTPNYDVIKLYDDEHGQYIIQKLGWKESKRINQIVLQVAIRDGKIWIEDDWTEDGIATYFLEHGIPRENIVLGFQPPIMRPYTEFAVA